MESKEENDFTNWTDEDGNPIQGFRHPNRPDNKFKPFRKRQGGTYKADIVISDIINMYQEAYKDTKTVILDKKLHRQILEDYYKLLMEGLIYKAKVYEFGHGLGHLYIQKKKMKLQYLQTENKMQLDYRTSMKTEKKVFHLNEHTNGFRMKFKWAKTGSQKFSNKYKYLFLATRHNKRALAKRLLTDKTADYLL